MKSSFQLEIHCVKQEKDPETPIWKILTQNTTKSSKKSTIKITPRCTQRTLLVCSLRPVVKNDTTQHDTRGGEVLDGEGELPGEVDLLLAQARQVGVDDGGNLERGRGNADWTHVENPLKAKRKQNNYSQVLEQCIKILRRQPGVEGGCWLDLRWNLWWKPIVNKKEAKRLRKISN